MPAAIIIGAEKPETDQELDIPANAVAIDGTAPETGDEIEFTIKAKVSKTNGKNLSVVPLECNGQAIEKEAEAEEDSSDPDDSAMNKAEKADADEEAGFGHY